MKILKKLFILALICTVLGVGTIFGFYLYLKPELPDVATLRDIRLQTPMQIYSRDGKLMAQFGEKRRIPVKLENIPQPMINAFIATEDNRYYGHVGVDPIGILRAASVVLTTGSARQGASTITQQLARNFFLTKEKKLMRKIKEAFIAIHIEKLLDKQEILELYLNKIYLGYRSYGVAAAAQVYFGKTLDELTLSEMAIIAGLPKAPSTMNPIYSIDRATTRRNVVLGRMLTENYITQQEYDQAKNEPIVAHYHQANIELSAPYAAERARQWMVNRYGEDAYTSGIKVYTTIDSKLQTYAHQAAVDNLFAYDMRHGYRGEQAKVWQTNQTPLTQQQIKKYLSKQPSYSPLQPAVVKSIDAKQKSAHLVLKGKQEDITLDWDAMKWARRYKTDKLQGPAPKTVAEIMDAGDQIWVRKISDKEGNEQWLLAQLPLANTAFVSLDINDGAVQSMIGGFNFQYSKFNRATMSVRQVGSNIKPFIYSAALNKGLTLASMINDAPIIQWDRFRGEAWRPRNSPEKYLGPLPLKRGLAQSKNVMAIRVLRAVGIDDAVDYITRFGFKKDELPHVEALALGAASLTPIELARGYAVFANGGYLVNPYFIDHLESPFGDKLYAATPMTVCKENCPTQGSAFNDSLQNLTTLDTEEIARSSADNTYKDIVLESERTEDIIAQESGNENNYAPRVISQHNAFLMQEMLKANIWGGGSWKYKTGWNGTGWRAQKLKRHDIGGKTGTTNDAKDTWYTGFAPHMIATVWVGFDDNVHKLGKTKRNKNLGKDQVSGAEAGAKTAEPAWISFMHNALADVPKQSTTLPKGIIKLRIDNKTGLLTKDTNPATSLFEFFVKGTEPTQYVEEETDNSVIIHNEDGTTTEIPTEDNPDTLF